MIELSLSSRIITTEDNRLPVPSPSSETKSANQYRWCYENAASVHIASGTFFDKSLPQLEIDDKPLVYRQQFETTVKKIAVSYFSS